MSTQGVATASAVSRDPEYLEFARQTAERINRHLGPMFTTSADPEALWAEYLTGLPADERQHYNCHCCRRFIQRFGGLVAIDRPGASPRSLLWDNPDVPPMFHAAVAGMRAAVERAKVDGVFLSKETTWGTPTTGIWSHLSGFPAAVSVYADKTKTAGQAMAEKHEDFGMLGRALNDYKLPVVEQAVRVLKGDVLPGAEKALAAAEWFAKRYGEAGSDRWLAVATAPAGWCHVRSGILSTLLDDVLAGLGFDAIAARWSAKMHPLQYRRPQAPPKAGAIDVAEKLFETMGAARALERRYARLDEVTAKLWVPKPAEPARGGTGGVFGHLRAPEPGTTPVELPAVRMTWEKFARTILPEARRMEVLLRRGGAFFGLTTAVHADAPNLLQWDNPVAWYFLHPFSTPERWNLAPGWGEVTAVFLAPHAWTEPRRASNQRRLALFAVKGARDTGNPGLCLFNETVRSEYHGVRAVIEAHGKTGRLQGGEYGDANGIAFQADGDPSLCPTIRVDGSASYVLDRWD